MAISITSPLLDSTSGIAHGFFTRQGGMSEGIYASLNAGIGSQDDPAAITENRRRIADALGATTLCSLAQIHSDQVVTINSWDGTKIEWSHAASLLLDGRPEADAMVTNQSGLALGILTADCGPVLFADPTARIIGAAHAGWKGAIGGVLENTIHAMEALGANRQRIIAAIGPCIAQPSYEVDAEFYTRFTEQSALYGTFFCASDRADHFRFDLAGFIHHQLQQSGLQQVEDLAMDTYCNADQFFSYRRTTHRGEGDYGRQISAIMLQEAH